MRVELSEWLGEPIQDAEEGRVLSKVGSLSRDLTKSETFMLFSQDIPSSNLGFVDEKANVVELEITGRSLSLRQSPGLLQSQRSGGMSSASRYTTPLTFGIRYYRSSPMASDTSDRGVAFLTVLPIEGCWSLGSQLYGG